MSCHRHPREALPSLWLCSFYSGLRLGTEAKTGSRCAARTLRVSNASEKEGRRVADQFERIRSVFHMFHMTFPRMRVDPNSPIMVLATKDENTFKTLVPESWLQKGQLRDCSRRNQRDGGLLPVPPKKYSMQILASSTSSATHFSNDTTTPLRGRVPGRNLTRLHQVSHIKVSLVRWTTSCSCPTVQPNPKVADPRAQVSDSTCSFDT